MTIVLAVDPGLTGALAFYIPDCRGHVSVYDMPTVANEVDAAALQVLIKDCYPDIAYIEHVGPMPRDGVRQAWRFSAAYTTVRVVASLLEIPVIRVTPGKWKKAMGVGGKKQGKEQARAKAIELFPSCASHFARKKDAGRAEAALIAYYAVHHLGYAVPDIYNVAAL